MHKTTWACNNVLIMSTLTKNIVQVIVNFCLNVHCNIQFFLNNTNNWHIFSDTAFTITLTILVRKGLRNNTVSRLSLRYALLTLLSVSVSYWLLGCTQLESINELTKPTKPPATDCTTPDCIPLTVTKVNPTHKPPAAVPQGLPIPVFSLTNDSIAYGTRVPISATDMPPGALLEYSYDNGKAWTIGNQVPVISSNAILARTRVNDLVSAIAQANYVPYFQRMLVIGNSIMSHGPAPELGWYNTNGMAASAPEKDFVHLLTSHLAGLYPTVSTRLQNGGNFERGFGLATYSLDEFNEPLQVFKPDLIIVRIGENVDEGEVLGGRNFEKQFRALLDKFASYTQPTKIVCTTSVWPRPQADAIIRKVTLEKGYPLVDLSEMVPQSKYFASQYTNPGVSAHPNDLGMLRIADLIWQKIP
jgi:hypothetical protein